MVESLIQQLSLDAHRVYIAGISIGGYAAWDLMVMYPNLFAAALTASGAGDVAQTSKLKDIPIWAFHNTTDFVISTLYDRQTYEQMQAIGGIMK